MKITRALVTIVFVGAFIYTALGSGIGKNLPDPYQLDFKSTVTDTIPVTDNYGDHITDPNKNPFDITSSVIEQKVEYDPESGHYIIFEKIGDEYYRTPSYLTFEEYLEYEKKKQEREYFNRLAGITTKKKGVNALIDPMERIDVQNTLVDRLFGGTEVNIQPQGQIDITLQSTYFNNFQQAFGRTGSVQFNPIDPDVDISVSVDGNIGTKMNLAFNYDTQSTFDFDRKIKLEYDTEAFGEDDIIKKIEAGNVSLPLRGSLIQGAQSLFGLKTELQFGHLRLTAIASQQQSSQNNITIENGAATQRFELSPDMYDENRHFFLSHYNRETFEDNLSNLPQINTSFRISQLEVWISTTGNTGQNYAAGTADIVAISDLAEPDITKYTGKNPSYLMNYAPTDPPPTDKKYVDLNGNLLPDNKINPIFDLITTQEGVEDRNQVSTILSMNGFQENTDFEAFAGRKLSPNEYTFNERLGFLSLNIRLRPNQSLAVAYNYTYTANCDDVYNVGTLSGDGTQFANLGNNTEQDTMPESAKVLFTKLLKATNQVTNNPQWDLMMKNVYPLRASNLDPEEFRFDIFYEDDSDGTFKKFIPGFETRPLLQVFNLDRLNKYNDPQSDGVFDFVPGITIIPSSGSVVFPLLEPFGSSLDSILPGIPDNFKYQELYDTSVTIARLSLEKNKFLLAGEVQSATSGEINLGPFVPQGSVRVRAGGILLVEGSDYEVDYSLGRLRIINESYLQQGTPINVSFEDQALFSLQQKTMLGLRADYEFNDNLSIGATYLRLFERPFTEKVNIGNDPINNRIFGLDLAYSNEAPFLTKMVDKLPFYSTKERSSINFSAEAAYLKPGHSGAINNGDDDGGVVSIDDFEGAVTGLLLGGFNSNQWRLASTPTDRYPEATLNNDLLYGVNRARINWYVIDRQARAQQDFNEPYTRLVDQTDLFSREVQIGQSELITFDVGYYPNERGPYNFDTPGGKVGVAGDTISKGIFPDPETGEIRLRAPETRWGGIMRSFQNTDFEAANYEFIEFWMLSPFMPRPDGVDHEVAEEGKIIFHLGNVSEDILKDGEQFYENSIPVDSQTVVSYQNTNWGRIPNVIPITNGFVPDNVTAQDVGYDGLDDPQEQEKYQDYLQEVTQSGNFNSQVLFDDPCADNYEFIEAQNTTLDLLTRYKKFNNPQGNAPFERETQNSFQRGNRFAESEDLNNNKFLDKGENYYQYVLELKREGDSDRIDISNHRFITQDTVVTNPSGVRENWYRVRIPITTGYDQVINNIAGFRAIQFMKMYMTEFKTAKTFRLADFQLVRNIWRRSQNQCFGDVSPGQVQFDVDEIGIEENGNKEPFGYISPRDIKQERLFSTFSNLLQDEKSLALNFCNLEDGCNVGINKLARLDLTLYEKLQLFFHAESDVNERPIEEGELYGYVRFGKDLVDHYYEYEIPLVISDPNAPQSQENIWPDTNLIDVKLEHFIDAKQQRIARDSILTNVYTYTDPERADGIIRIKGTPSLGYIKVFEIGVRNRLDNEERDPICGSVWVNELRATGLNEDGGLAAQARLQVQLADLGEVNVAANYSSIGWGALDQRLAERNREELLQYDIATNLQLGKFFPQEWGINLPFYAQYSKNNAYRQFEPYERDMTVDQKIEALNEKKDNFPDQSEAIDAEIEDVKDRSKETTTIKTFNFTNVKKDGKGGKPWSVSNFSASYSYTETNKTDFIIKEDRTKEYGATLDYNYTNKMKPIQPFKKIKSKALRIIKEINFNPFPKSFTFSTNMNRLTNTRVFRLPVTPVFQFDDRRFLWDRNYGLNWDFTKNLRFNFKAQSRSIVDELRQVGINPDGPEFRDWVDERGNLVDITDPSQVTEYRNQNLRQLGRNKDYRHNFGLQYTLPIRYLPMMDWINIKADYKADYGWTAGALILIDDRMIDGMDGTPLGNTIQNSQSRSLNGTFSFDKLYSKSKYLKKIDKGNKASRSSRRRTSRSRSNSRGNDGKTSQKEEKEERQVTTLERILLRPLLALRSVKATYKESFNTFVPGFMPEAELLGLSSGFSSPGLNFAAGFQPDLDSWLLENNGWFNDSPNFNDEINQTRQQNIDVRIALEPFKDFDIDIDFKKSYREDHTEVFKFVDCCPDDPDKPAGWENLAQYDIGSFEVSNMGLGTLFKDNLELYQEFQDTRVLVSQAIGEAGTIHSESWPEYTEGYGPNSYEVAVPAFLATYLGQDISTYTNGTNVVDEVSKLSFLPKPNWTVKYDGLSKMDMFKDWLSAFTINHAYRGSMQVSRFNTTLEYREGVLEKSPVNDNYYSRIQIPTIQVNDQFSPLLGVSLKTKSELTFDAEWRKSRQMGLSLEELREQRAEEFRIGFGYTIKNFRSKKKSKRKRRRGQKEEAEEDKKGSLAGGGRNSRGGVNNNRGKTLTINFDFSITDTEELIYEVAQGTQPQPNSGQRTVQISPSVDYDVNENLTMRFFFDYNYSESAAFTASSNMRLNIRGGVTAQLKIN